LADNMRKASIDMLKPFPEMDFDKPGYTVVLDSRMQTLNGQLAYLVTVTFPDGTRMKYYYDEKSGLKLRQYEDFPEKLITEFGDYKDISNGVKIPYSEKTTLNGRLVEFKVKSVKVNAGMDDSPWLPAK
jgi:hypothetical protein